MAKSNDTLSILVFTAAKTRYVTQFKKIQKINLHGFYSTKKISNKVFKQKSISPPSKVKTNLFFKIHNIFFCFYYDLMIQNSN
jgi:hypothetical protein